MLKNAKVKKGKGLEDTPGRGIYPLKLKPEQRGKPRTKHRAFPFPKCRAGGGQILQRKPSGTVAPSRANFRKIGAEAITGGGAAQDLLLPAWMPDNSENRTRREGVTIRATARGGRKKDE